MQSYFTWEQMYMKLANAPSAPFFLIGRVPFIYIGVHEARKGENTNMKSPRTFWTGSRKTQHLQGEAKQFWSFLQNGSCRRKVAFWGSPVALAGTSGLPFCRLWIGLKGERLCNCSKASWNFLAPFVSKQEHKVPRSLKRGAEASGSFFS